MVCEQNAAGPLKKDLRHIFCSFKGHILLSFFFFFNYLSNATPQAEIVVCLRIDSITDGFF